jgi:dTDP-4-amino-4,6-dideoxygalactose transaminase
MIAPAEQLGARPCFYPLTADAAPDLEFLARQDLAGVRAMVAVHYFGLPLQLKVVKQFCVERGIVLIEDCAHAFFGAIGNQPIGGVGDAVVASLTKFFPVTEGGCLVMRNPRGGQVKLAHCGWRNEFQSAWDAIELASQYRRFGLLGVPLRGLFALKNLLRRRRAAPVASVMPAAKGEAVRVRIDEARAVRGISRASRLIVASANRHRIVERRRKNYDLLCECLGSIEGLKVLFPRLPDAAAPYVCPVAVEFADPRYQALRNKGVPVMRWDQIWPGTPTIEGDVGGAWAHSVFQLVCHQDLGEDEIRFTASTLIDVLRDVHP